MIEYNLQIAKEAAQRWASRQQTRDEKTSKINAGDVLEAIPLDRVQKNQEYREKAEIREITKLANLEARMPDERLALGRERIIGRSDLLGLNFLEKGTAVSRFVGRVHVRNSNGAERGFGTGFMVSPRLLLTNNHVLGNASEARFSEIEFDFQSDRFGRMLPVVTFGLESEKFFLTDEELDFALVAVRPISNNGIDLKLYGWNRLIEEEGKAIEGNPLNIIQHPLGEPKQLAIRSNNLLDILENFAHYETDTEPGSSGSPVFNDMWEVIALHHSGVPKTDAAGNLIAKNGTIWRQGTDDPRDLDWIANEGVRVSRLIKYFKAQTLSGQQADLMGELLTLEPPHPFEIAARAEEQQHHVNPMNALPIPNFSRTISIPLEITISLGTPAQQPGITLPSVAPAVMSPVKPPEPVLTSTLTETISIDPNYATRKGYNPEFLGTGNRLVPLPSLTAAMKAKAAINQQANGLDKFVLPYHHFSVVMNGERRMAFLTAVNIDGKKSNNLKRDSDKWIFDPRIKREEQIGEEVYARNDLDRGHLVRRLDPAWGTTEKIARTANDDTFHFSNCTPQHHAFNAGQTLWAGLEDYILNNAQLEDIKVSVFTGPVLDDNDPEYRGIQLPRQYWKVVAIVKPDKKLSATAYLLSQEDLIEGLEEAFVFGQYRTFQVTLNKIEALTKLDFGALKTVQPPILTESFEAEHTAPLESFAQIRL